MGIYYFISRLIFCANTHLQRDPSSCHTAHPALLFPRVFPRQPVCRCPDLPSCIIMFLSGPHKGIIKEQPSHRYLISNTEMVRLHFVYIGLDTYYCWFLYTDTLDTVIRRKYRSFIEGIPSYFSGLV